MLWWRLERLIVAIIGGDPDAAARRLKLVRQVPTLKTIEAADDLAEDLVRQVSVWVWASRHVGPGGSPEGLHDPQLAVSRPWV